eukprot:6740043-Prymnesium_polylepis.1
MWHVARGTWHVARHGAARRGAAWRGALWRGVAVTVAVAVAVAHLSALRHASAFSTSLWCSASDCSGVVILTSST